MASRGSVVARIRLTPEAASVWSGLDKSVKVKLGALFNELILSYARESKLPVLSLSVSEEALKLIITGFEACKGQLEACKRQVELTQAEVSKLKQEIERAREASEMIKNLSKQLNEANKGVEQLKQQVEMLERENKHMKNWLETLANILCPQLETLKSIYSSNSRVVIELEALCWRKRQS
jgi:DNA repair exonuclease SbcCD ATPase subunit